MLTQLVRTGCRVIELDCYNNSQPGDFGAYVKHKLCPTISLDFSACIEAIKAGIKLEKDDRLSTRPRDPQVKQGPLIITLENHATGKNYKEMGVTMRTVFGDLLHLPGDDESQVCRSPACVATPPGVPHAARFGVCVAGWRKRLRVCGGGVCVGGGAVAASVTCERDGGTLTPRTLPGNLVGLPPPHTRSKTSREITQMQKKASRTCVTR